MTGSRSKIWVVAVLTAFVATSAVRAAKVEIFRSQSADAFLAGKLAGVTVGDSGGLALAPHAERLAELGEPFAFSLVATRNGWAIGTGNDGKVMSLGHDGKASVLFDAPEAEIFALWADADGTLFAGSSPDGKVYRISKGSSEVYFDPEETYIWAIARGADGALWVATGSPGRLYRVTAQGKAEKAWDGGATHVRSLLPLKDGDLLFGTAGDGRILRWHAGKVRTIYDSEASEVAALAAAPDGAVWAALLTSEASLTDLTPKPAPASAATASASAGTAVVVVTGSSGTGRAAGSTSPRSQLVRVLASGASENVWSSDDETIFSLLADRDGLWMGTGLEGHLYRVENDRVRLVRDFDEKQVVGLAAAADGPVALTTNGTSLWRFTQQREARGIYTSAALDAGQSSRFGVFRWRGEMSEGASVTASFRSGFSAEPDETWSDWSAPRSGSELALGALPRGRFVQYRLELAAGHGAGPEVSTTELSYRQENLRPAIRRFYAMDPGQILVPTGFNPGDQVFEPVSPDKGGIFTTLEAAPSHEDRFKTVWKQGWRTLRWEASDPNDDSLRYRLDVKSDGAAGGWLKMVDDLDATHWSFDSRALPDGLYRFRLTADDAKDNVAGAALTAERGSEPVLIDNTPPELRGVARRGRGLAATVYDAASPLRSAELSIDGGEWRDVAPADGLLDGQSEVILLPDLPAKTRIVLLRVSDAAFNLRTFDLSAELRK